MISKFFIILTLTASFAARAGSHDRGRYLVRTMGCNDCHTPQYAMKGGDLPESQWLIGSDVGFNGPWGTTYPVNIRQIVQNMDEKSWIDYIRNIRSRPPMPSYDTSRISDRDLKDVYRYVKSLGGSNNIVPQYLPPGEKPKTAYIDFSVHAPN